MSDIPFWVTFYFEWHSILGEIPFWVTLYFEWHSILSDWLVSQSQWWDLRWYRTINFQSLCEWVSEQSADLEMLVHLKICILLLQRFLRQLSVLLLLPPAVIAIHCTGGKEGSWRQTRKKPFFCELWTFGIQTWRKNA